MAKRPAGSPRAPGSPSASSPGKPKRARDVDNLGKGLLDLMQALGIVSNDRDVVDLHIAWDTSGLVEPGNVQVELREIGRAAA